MRKLQTAAGNGDRDAELAIEVFCLSIRKLIAAYAAVLSGLDMLIFAGGIGEHSARVRSGVCEGLRFLGILIDEHRNQANEGTMSDSSSAVPVCIVASQEDRQIARHCRAMMRKS